MAHCDDRSGWRLDRRISVSAIVSGVTCCAVVIGLIASLEVRLEGLEAQSVLLRDEMREARKTVLRVERIDERMTLMQRLLEEIRTDLRQRSERP